MNREDANSLPRQELNALRTDLPLDIANLESTVIRLITRLDP